MENRDFVIQRRLGLGEEKEHRYYIFSEGSMVWPKRSKRGVLTQDLQARKLQGEKAEGFQAWEAESNIHLYFDRKHWQLSVGTVFGAPVSSAKERKLK